MSIKACIFDLDGVICDSAKYHFDAWKRLAESLGISFTEADNALLKGVSRKESLERILEWGDVQVAPDQFEELMERKNGWYLESIEVMEDDEILPGVKRFLGELKEAGFSIALGSSSKNARRILGQLGIDHFFDAIVDGTDISRSKPDPEVFELGAEALELQPKECIVFEDAVAGIKAAQDGGFLAMGIGTQEELPNAPRVIPGFCDFGLRELRALSL